jgi:hypothetical protein
VPTYRTLAHRPTGVRPITAAWAALLVGAGLLGAGIAIGWGIWG